MNHRWWWRCTHDRQWRTNDRWRWRRVDNRRRRWRMDNWRRWYRMNNWGRWANQWWRRRGMDDRRRWGRRVNDSGRRFGNRRRYGRRIDSRFRSQIHRWRRRGSGRLGSGFTIVFGVAVGGGGTGEGFAGVGAMSVPAGGLAPAGGVTTPGAFPLRGVAGTPDEGSRDVGRDWQRLCAGRSGDRSRRLSRRRHGAGQERARPA